MAVLVRIYYNAVFGGLGGLFGWLLYGILVEKTPSTTIEWVESYLGGALLGACIGYFVVSVEAIRDRSLLRFCRLATYGVVLSLVGGALGLIVGEKLHQLSLDHLVIPLRARGLSGFWELVILALFRGLGWTCLGVMVGASEGIAARSLGKLSYGTIGGLLGGFVGGTLFGFIYEKFCKDQTIPAMGAATLWMALGMVILGGVHWFTIGPGPGSDATSLRQSVARLAGRARVSAHQGG